MYNFRILKARIRPAPYSTDMSINDYTYADIADEH
jgi:hypothetical protein